MIVLSLNVGKLSASSRAASFFRSDEVEQADVICVQSAGVPEDRYPPYASLYGFRRFSAYHATVGTTGVAIYTREEASLEATRICDHDQCAGRHIEVRLQSGLLVASTYIRSGAENRAAWTQHLSCVAQRMREYSREAMIVAGDFNLAMEPIDLWLAAPKSQYGFTPYTRGLFQDLQTANRWRDTYRYLHPQERQYSRWPSEPSYPSKGWRIDYQWASDRLRSSIVRAEVLAPKRWDDRFSDHAPTLAEYRV